MITAMLSIWIPGMRKLCSQFSDEGKKRIQKSQQYTQILVGKFKEKCNQMNDYRHNLYQRFRSNEAGRTLDQESDRANSSSPKKMAEIIITPDTKTNGLFEDLELIIQLVIDQSTLKMKIVSKKGIGIAHSCVDLFKFNGENHQTSMDSEIAVYNMFN